MRRILILCLIFMSLLAITGSASIPSRSKADEIIVNDVWIPEGPPSAKATAAFMVIENHTAKEVALIAAKTDAARATEMHKMEMRNEIMEMKKIERISIPAHGKAELKPGGLHLMLIGLTKPLKEGDKVSFTLQFSNSTEKTIQAVVKKRNL